MAVALLLAFAPNALFLQHYGIFEAPAADAQAVVDQHAEHRPPSAASAKSSTSTTAQPTVHCHVGPENCSASSGLSNAIVISTALALTLLGGSAFLLDPRSGRLSLFDITRRLIVPPRMNLLSI
jgi:hypothetical protein